MDGQASKHRLDHSANETPLMNQQIQVQDGFELHSNQRDLIIKAYDGGMQITCVIEDIESDPQEFYLQAQFDLEEKLIELIENEQYDPRGVIHLSARLL